jgi:hypothetical protein
MSDQSTQRPRLVIALVSLIDRLLADPLTAHLAAGGIWTVNATSLSLIHHADEETADEVLRTVGELLGTEFARNDKAAANSGNTFQYEAKGHWDGSRVSMILFAPGESEAEQLRTRVAELEAQLAARPPADLPGGAA